MKFLLFTFFLTTFCWGNVHANWYRKKNTPNVSDVISEKSSGIQKESKAKANAKENINEDELKRKELKRQQLEKIPESTSVGPATFPF